MYDRDLDEIYEQYSIALRSHFQHIEQLMQLQTARLQGLEQEFERDVKKIKKEFENESKSIQESHMMANKEIFDIINLVKKEETTKNENEKSFDETNREEQKNKKTEEYRTLEEQIKEQIIVEEGKFEDKFDKHKEDTQQTEQ